MSAVFLSGEKTVRKSGGSQGRRQPGQSLLWVSGDLGPKAETGRAGALMEVKLGLSKEKGGQGSSRGSLGATIWEVRGGLADTGRMKWLEAPGGRCSQLLSISVTSFKVLPRHLDKEMRRLRNEGAAPPPCPAF